MNRFVLVLLVASSLLVPSIADAGRRSAEERAARRAERREAKADARVERLRTNPLYSLANAAAEDLVGSGAKAIVAEGKSLLTDPEVAASVERLVDGMIRRVDEELLADLPELTGQLGEQIGDQARQTIVATTAEIMENVLADDTIAEVEDIASEISVRLATDLSPVLLREAEKAIDVLAPKIGEATATQLRTNLGPALGDVMRNDLMPAFVDTLANDEFNQAAQQASHSVATGALDAMAQSLASDGALGRVIAAERERTLDEISSTVKEILQEATVAAEKVIRRLTILAVVLGLVIIAVLIAFILARKATQERELALRLVASQIRDKASDNEEIAALVKDISARSKADVHGRHLRSFFDRNPEFNAKKKTA